MSEQTVRNLQPQAARYDPLPFETEPGQFRAANNYSRGLAPSSPSAENLYYPMSELPAGASRPPRFQGSFGPESRFSVASSQGNFPGSENSSVYALNNGFNPSATHLAGYRDDPNDSYAYADQSQSANYLPEKNLTYASPRDTKRKWILLVGGAIGVLIVIAGIAIPLYEFVIKPHHSDNTSGNNGTSPSNPSSTGSSSQQKIVVTGGDGTTVTKDDGTTFTYTNSFGGYWYFDPKDPFNNAARSQSWNPALNQSFQYGVDIIRGVNIGGWLNTEPFISPALYEKYLNSSTQAVDEWTLSENMRADTAGGGIQQLEDHYATFITEEDFAQIAGAGLNFVRIPLPYWAIETRGEEPFLAQVSWTYFLKAIAWARKYGIRISLDLHALPGSQNGWNHSGRLGTINVLNGPMGYANAQRSLDYIRILAEFISQPDYKDVVVMFGVTNEPDAITFGQDPLSRYYLQAYDIVRNAGGTGIGNGPVVLLHDGFLGEANWAGFLPGADRLALDTHPYLCFGGQSAGALSTFLTAPCSAWAEAMNTSMSAFGLSLAGEFSLATNDCGLYVNGVGLGTRYEGTYDTSTVTGSCDSWLAWQSWDDTTKQQYQQLALASMDALQNWFFWTWKIGNSSVSGVVEAPHWSYQLGLQNGWMPTDPRGSVGTCGNTNPWPGPLQPWQTGGPGGGIPDAVSQSLAWPPPTLTGGLAIQDLPSYTPTAAVPTLSGAVFTYTTGKTTSTIIGGDGWLNTADTAGMMTDAAGCSYLDPWVGSAAPPSPLCTGVSRIKRDALPDPIITPFPH